MKGNSNPSGNSIDKVNDVTGEPLDPNHWDNLR